MTSNPPLARAARCDLSAAGFIATSVSGSSPGVKIWCLENEIWKLETPANDPAGARISAGKSGNVEKSLPKTAVASAKRLPASCMPSPESPAKRTVTRSRSWIGIPDPPEPFVCVDVVVISQRPPWTGGYCNVPSNLSGNEPAAAHSGKRSHGHQWPMRRRIRNAQASAVCRMGIRATRADHAVTPGTSPSSRTLRLNERYPQVVS